ncbi:hypothetical protein F5Y18DRAFT_443308 [Xylariaceae sp. FL1019]|nr:hypothetical protein F5Y18DRAFT_443308 [Xylariaceae sp. FL1019]
MEFADADQVITVLDGAVSTRVIRHHDRSFAFEVTLDLVKGAKHFQQKPPMHFHANQDEYIQAVQGVTGLEIDGKEIELLPGQPEYRIKSWKDHRSYPIDADRQKGVTLVKFLLSGAKTPEVYGLDLLFFENWYRYQEHVVNTGGSFSLIQVLSTFDAGGTYLSLPWYIPFGSLVSQSMGIILGRWFGGALGYQPFYEQWSTNWELACEKMKSSFFQRRFATRAKTS